jgi:hypothetical protein
VTANSRVAKGLTEPVLVLLLQRRNLDLEQIFSSAGRPARTTSLLERVVLLIVLMNESIQVESIFSPDTEEGIASAPCDARLHRLNIKMLIVLVR